MRRLDDRAVETEPLGFARGGCYQWFQASRAGPSATTQPDVSYRTATVETKLQAITLKQLLNYIYRIETSRNMVKLSRLSVTKTGKQAGTIDAVLLVETFEL